MNEFMQPLFDFVIKTSDKRERHFDLPDSTSKKLAICK